MPCLPYSVVLPPAPAAQGSAMQFQAVNIVSMYILMEKLVLETLIEHLQLAEASVEFQENAQHNTIKRWL